MTGETRCKLHVEINLKSQQGPLEMGSGILVLVSSRKGWWKLRSQHPSGYAQTSGLSCSFHPGRWCFSRAGFIASAGWAQSCSPAHGMPGKPSPAVCPRKVPHITPRHHTGASCPSLQSQDTACSCGSAGGSPTGEGVTPFISDMWVKIQWNVSFHKHFFLMRAANSFNSCRKKTPVIFQASASNISNFCCCFNLIRW